MQNPDKKVLVIDLCPQANSSSMLLGGMVNGERVLNAIHSVMPRILYPVMWKTGF
nr:hypothetical protein [Aeromonas sp. WP2-W18-CRE-05]